MRWSRRSATARWPNRWRRRWRAPARRRPPTDATDVGGAADLLSERWGDTPDQRRRSSAARRNTACATRWSSSCAVPTAAIWCRSRRSSCRATTSRRRPTRSAPTASARSWPRELRREMVRLDPAPDRCARAHARPAPQVRCAGRDHASRRATATALMPPPARARRWRADQPERLAAQLAPEPLRPAYLIAGPEPLRVLEAADAVRAAARAQGIAEREVFEAEGNQREPDWDALEASFRAPEPVRAAGAWSNCACPPASPARKAPKLIIEFCADPPADVCLLVTAASGASKHGGKWSEAIGRIGASSSSPGAIKPHELPDWIERRLRAQGPARRSRRGAAAGRARRRQPAGRRAGNRQARAARPTASTLDAARMDALVADAARFDVFRLVDAAMNGQRRAGLAHARRPARRRRGGAGAAGHGGDGTAARRGAGAGAGARRQPRRRVQGAADLGFASRRCTSARCSAIRRRAGSASSPRPGASTASPRAAGVAGEDPMTRGCAGAPAAGGRRCQGACACWPR